MKSMKLIAATTVLACWAFGATVQADAPGQDWKGYAGVNCLPASENADIRRSVSGSSTAIANMGKSTISVFCPVVRDVAEGGNDRVLRVRVLLNERNEKTDCNCQFSAHAIDGTLFDSDSADCSGTGMTTLTLGPIDASNWGSYALRCTLPGRGENNRYLPSYLINYRVDEVGA